MSDWRYDVVGMALLICSAVVMVAVTAAAVTVAPTTPLKVLAGMAGLLAALVVGFGGAWLLTTLKTTDDRPWPLGEWYRRRKRAICLGDMGHARLWYDPIVGDLWQANSRYALFVVSTCQDDPERALEMLEHVSRCEAYVGREDIRG